MSRAMQLMMGGVGMGEVGPWVDPVAFEREFGPAPSLTGTGHSTRDAILGIVGAGLQTVTSLVRRNNPPQQVYTPGPVGAANNGAPPEAVGFSIDGQGVNLPGAGRISWVLIAVGALAIKLLQSKPYTRAGR